MKLFKLYISQENRDILKQIRIDHYIDPFRSNIKGPGFTSFDIDPYETIYNGCKNTSKDNSDTLCHNVATLIKKIINVSIEKFKTEMNISKYNIVLWLRFEPSSTEFDIPRWHVDGGYRINGNTDIKYQKKIIISLKGPGTMLAECKDPTNKEIINQIRTADKDYPRYEQGLNKKNMKKVNDIIEPILNDNCIIHQLENFQGVFYNVANHDMSGIHSEPKKNKPRIMLGLLINEL